MYKEEHSELCAAETAGHPSRRSQIVGCAVSLGNDNQGV